MYFLPHGWRLRKILDIAELKKDHITSRIVLCDAPQSVMIHMGAIAQVQEGII
jgi:hypothetical protein